MTRRGVVMRREVVAKICYDVYRKILPKYSSKRGPKKYKF